MDPATFVEEDGLFWHHWKGSGVYLEENGRQETRRRTLRQESDQGDKFNAYRL